MCCGMHLNIYEQEVFKILKNNVELFLELKINNFCLKKAKDIFHIWKNSTNSSCKIKEEEGDKLEK